MMSVPMTRQYLKPNYLEQAPKKHLSSPDHQASLNCFSLLLLLLFFFPKCLWLCSSVIIGQRRHHLGPEYMARVGKGDYRGYSVTVNVPMCVTAGVTTTHNRRGCVGRE